MAVRVCQERAAKRFSPMTGPPVVGIARCLTFTNFLSLMIAPPKKSLLDYLLDFHHVCHSALAIVVDTSFPFIKCGDKGGEVQNDIAVLGPQRACQSQLEIQRGKSVLCGISIAHYGDASIISVLNNLLLLRIFF
jgi:hypothetical protein